MTDRPVDRSYLPALTGLRALAAYLVFLHHFNPFDVPESWPRRLCMEGHVGVTVFFVLSGFLICHRYPWLWNPAGVLADRRRLTGYCINRFARIYPVYLLLTLYTIHKVSLYDWELWLTNLTMLRGFSDRLKFTGVGQGWSLTVEECFYFSAPVLLPLTAAWSLHNQRL